ncbi:MAG: rod shape-determining protein MreC, partial [Patescibacteria group bacterium]
TSRIAGAILATPPRSPYDTAVIDVGTNDGVSAGNLVLSGSTILGVVGKAYTHTSLVEFFSTAGRKTPVSILHAGFAIPVEAVGEGGGSFKAILPKEVAVSRGDYVTMPGLVPFAFAEVEVIESSVTDSFQVIRFKNPLSIGTLRMLEVELSPQE